MAKRNLITKAERRCRLLKLADFLARIPPPKREAFNMNHWARHSGEHKPPVEGFCGTSACALGWAATMPAFNAAGLRLKWDLMDPQLWGCEGSKYWDAEVKLGRLEGEFAGQRFFGLSYDEADKIFLGAQVAPKQKARQLRALANRKPPRDADCR